MRFLQLLAPGEITPGLTAAEYSQRRATLASLMPANSFAVVPGAAAQYMVGLIPHPFRQDADFRYLTGVLQKSVVAVVESSSRGRVCISLALACNAALFITKQAV